METSQRSEHDETVMADPVGPEETPEVAGSRPEKSPPQATDIRDTAPPPPEGMPDPAAAAGSEPPQPPPDPAAYPYGVPPGYGQPYFSPGYVDPRTVGAQSPTPEQIAAQQAEAAQRYSRVVQSVEQFVGGEATVADVVKTLYTQTAQDGQLWKGIIVGAAAAVLLTNESTRAVMGKTIGALFPNLKAKKSTSDARSRNDQAKQNGEKET